MSEDAEVVAVERPLPHIGLIRLQRPQAGNAVTPQLAQALEAAVRTCEEDADIWVTVLTGAGGKVFCAGADLKEVAAGRAEQLLTPDGGFAGFVNARRSKPCIAAVEGLALAGGLEIVLACDLVVASEHASFGLPEVKRSLIALAGGAYRLPRLLPRALALEMILTGSSMPAETALAHGLVNRLVPKGQACEAALQLASTICDNAPLAVRESLAIAKASADLSESELQRLGAEAWRRLLRSEDFREGPRAFIEKRPAQWRGR